MSRTSATRPVASHPHPPGQAPPRLPPAPELRRDRLKLLMRAAREVGDVVQMRFGVRDFYLFVHPDAIQHIVVTNHRNYRKGPDHMYLKPVIGEGLITSDGAFHLRHRRMIQPGFHRTRISKYGAAMTAYATDMLDGWDDGSAIDLFHQMMRLTLRIVIWTLCGVDVADDDDPMAPSLRSALGYFTEETESLLPNTRRLVRELDEVIYRIISERRARGGDTGDLLSVLLGALDDGSEEGLTDLQVRDEFMTLFFAGHDTTASALSWTWYLLAQHPRAEAALHEEIDRVLHGRVPTVADVSRLPYTTMVFAEAMRLYPPVWSLSRQTLADDVVCGYHVPAGMPVMVSPYVTHRDARFYDEPDVFDPDRFHPDHDVRKVIPRQAYAPFGGGVRQCMGEPYAWMEGALLIATIAQRFRFVLRPEYPVEEQSLITLRPKSGVHVIAHAR